MYGYVPPQSPIVYPPYVPYPHLPAFPQVPRMQPPFVAPQAHQVQEQGPLHIQAPLQPAQIPYPGFFTPRAANIAPVGARIPAVNPAPRLEVRPMPNNSHTTF